MREEKHQQLQKEITILRQFYDKIVEQKEDVIRMLCERFEGATSIGGLLSRSMLCLLNMSTADTGFGTA